MKHAITGTFTVEEERKNIAVEEKIYALLFLKNYRYGCKMAVLGCGYLSQHVLESS